MPWCPVCKSEYKEGVERCAECGVQLVEDLSQTEAEAEMEAEYEEPEEEVSGTEDEVREPVRLQRTTTPYKNRADKAEEFKSSGYVLLVVGVLGILCMVLIDLGILPLKLNNLLLMNIMMNILFVIFIAFGIYSLRGAKKYAGEADDEKNLTKEIRKWATQNLKAPEIDDQVECTEESEEIAYFKRYEYIRNAISEKFINLEENYLDYLTEHIYQELYEEQEEA